ncbi:hypothetical protein JCM10213v2_006666 [Rhodosporidiobolus nylandii]
MPPLPSSSASNLPTLRTLDSFSARNVASSLEPGVEVRNSDDVWQQVCVRVLPLFNGQGIAGFVEDINELVLNHVQRTFARFQTSSRSRGQQPSLDASSLITGLLAAELTDLIRLGCNTLSAKLSPPSPAFPLSDGRLLSRLNEIWLFFFTGILPHLEGVFWVLRCDHRLRAAAGDTWQDRERQGRTGRAEGRIDIRRIALIEFRDQILHPEFQRLKRLFAQMYRPQSVLNGMPSSSPTHLPEATLPAPPDFRHSRSQPARRASLSNSNSSLSPHPQPHRQHSSPSRLSPDPDFVASFPSSPAPTPRSAGFSPSPTSPTPLMSASNIPSALPSASTSPLPAAPAQALARRRQMVAVLSSLLTADDRQAEMDALLRLMRPNQSGGRRERTTTASPAATDNVDGDGAGADTGFTASPVIMEEPAELTPEDHATSQNGVLSQAVPPVVTRNIDARQRSRTMDSLDEEDGADGFVHVSPFPQQPHPLARHSTDGSASLFSLTAAGPEGETSDKEKKKQRRRSFLPRIGRSNSQVSSTGGESTEDDTPTAALAGLSDPASVAMGAPGSGNGASGDKLRRGLLRRNSSRRAADMVATMGALGTASGFAVEDDAIE